MFFLLAAPSAWCKPLLMDYYQQLKSELANTLPGTNISLTSSIHDRVHVAEVNSLLQTPFDKISSALSQVNNWCDIMPLHFNIKACTYQIKADNQTITIYSGRKIYQAPEDSYKMTYQFVVLNQDESQLSLRLIADRGPLSTSDYLIELFAIPVDEGTLLHIHTSYRSSFLSSTLTRLYLSTLGRNKVGFSLVQEDGEFHPVQGMKGVIERNVMRYHLAIKSFLGTQSPSIDSQLEARLASWFAQNNHYSQLYEMDESDYLKIKRKEWSNQQKLQRTLDINATSSDVYNE